MNTRISLTLPIFWMTTLFFGSMGGGIIGGGMGCGGTNALLEEAKFLLDGCNPTLESSLPNCQSAVAKADEIQQTDATNIDAALVESSGYTGLARVDFLSFASDLSSLEESGEGDFAQFRGFVADYEEALNADQGLTGLEIDLDQLRTAVVVLEEVLADVEVDDEGVAINPRARQALSQLGLIQGIDAFIRPVKLAGGGIANVVANITAEVTAIVQGDFLDADSNLIRGGGDESELGDILTPLRENYCRCSLNGGWNVTCLRDLMRCELYDGNGIEQDYNGNGAVALGDCETLLTPAGLDACGGTDTSE